MEQNISFHILYFVFIIFQFGVKRNEWFRAILWLVIITFAVVMTSLSNVSFGKFKAKQCTVNTVIHFEAIIMACFSISQARYSEIYFGTFVTHREVTV